MKPPRRPIYFVLALLAFSLTGCSIQFNPATPHRSFATADQLDKAATSGVIPEGWRQVDKEAAAILRKAKGL